MFLDAAIFGRGFWTLLPAGIRFRPNFRQTSGFRTEGRAVTDFESLARKRIEAEAAARGVTPEQLAGQMEQALYTLAAPLLAETAGDERERVRALERIDALLDRLQQEA